MNTDGHTLDVWVRWPDGEVLRPVVTVIADLYCNAILAYRVDKSESAAAKVTARAPSGSLHVLGNRYWSEWLSGHVGDRLTARFDPEDLAEPISVYGADGVYLGDAECWEAVGFHSVEAAREHGRKRRAYARHLREAAKIERGMSIDELVALQPAAATPAPQPEAKGVRMLTTRGATALKAHEVPQEEVSGMSQAEVLRLSVPVSVSLSRKSRIVFSSGPGAKPGRLDGRF